MQKGKKVAMPQPQRQGKSLSAEQIEKIQADQLRREHDDRVNILIGEWANSETYNAGLYWGGLIRQAFHGYSDLILKMPWETYRGVVSVADGNYTMQQMDIAMQLLSMVSAKDMDMSMPAYIEYKDALQELSAAFMTALEAGKQAIIEANPFIAQPVGEA